MNRRDFLKASAAAVAVAVIPWPSIKSGTVCCTTVETISYSGAVRVTDFYAEHTHGGILLERQHRMFPAINVVAGDSIEFTTTWRRG